MNGPMGVWQDARGRCTQVSLGDSHNLEQLVDLQRDYLVLSYCAHLSLKRYLLQEGVRVAIGVVK